MFVKKKRMFIILSVIILALSVCFTDAIIKPNYFIKSGVKIIFYLAIPSLYFLFNKKDRKDFKQLFYPNKKDFLKTLLLGLSLYIIMVIGYFLTKDIIDFSNLPKNLENNMGINKDNLIFVAFYVSIVNSFLEEFFYRGYAFFTLKKYTNRTLAYLFSASIFAFYHVGMMLESFNIPTLFLMVIGIFIGGCIFNTLNEKSKNIYPSWIVHMFVNFAMNTVGFILFNI